MLTRVAQDRHCVPSPTIDIIEDDTLFYYKVEAKNVGGFDADFTFKWDPVPERELKRIGPEKILPIRQATMAGGLFTIDKDFFYEIGSYDENMKIWGGENIEMSFRVSTL